MSGHFAASVLEKQKERNSGTQLAFSILCSPELQPTCGGSKEISPIICIFDPLGGAEQFGSWGAVALLGEICRWRWALRP